jgi:hypothetical protein
MKFEPTEKYWQSYAEENLVGKKVVSVRYMTDDEANSIGWYSRPLIIQFEDGTTIYSSRDDEGNDGGSMHGAIDGEGLTFPVLHIGFDKG